MFYPAHFSIGVFVMISGALLLGNHAGDTPFWFVLLAVPLATFAVCYLITLIPMNIPILRRTAC